MITLTKAAQEHFNQIIAKQSEDLQAKGLNLRIQAVQVGTDNAGIELSYCMHGEHEDSDLEVNYSDFILYIDLNSKQALKNAVIDYKQDHVFGAKLQIRAPFLKNNPNQQEQEYVGPDNKDLFNRIKSFLDHNIGPSLARHNGGVSLAGIKPINPNPGKVEVILQFSGGCKGCSMVNFTLKQGIEKSLREQFTEVALVTDVTDHANGSNPYCT